MTERWKVYVTEGVQKAGGPIPFALAQWTFSLPVLLAIRRAVPAGGRVLDVGCGAGIFAALLAHHGYQVVGVDDDADIVAYARQMVAYLRAPAAVEQASAFDLARYHRQFDLVYSLGVLEHFEPAVTVHLLQEQARCARFVVVVVPTRFARYAAPVTDERLYTRRQLTTLARRAGLRVRESFVYGDVPTRTARALDRWLPKTAYRGLRECFSYGMDLCCVGERPAAIDGASQE